MASRYEIVNLMGGAAQQGLNLRQAEIGVNQLSDGFCYWLGSNFGPLDLLPKGRKFLLEFRAFRCLSASRSMRLSILIFLRTIASWMTSLR